MPLIDEFELETAFCERVEQLLRREILFDCTEWGVSPPEAMRLTEEVAERLRREEDLERCAPENRLEIVLRDSRSALRRAGESLDTIKRDWIRFKRELLEGGT